MRLSVFLPFLAACVALNAWASEPQVRTLDIYWIDSEGGGSTLMVTPAGESVLVDTGNPGGRDAARIHKVATELAGLSRIDHVVITQFHGDHCGGLADTHGASHCLVDHGRIPVLGQEQNAGTELEIETGSATHDLDDDHDGLAVCVGLLGALHGVAGGVWASAAADRKDGRTRRGRGGRAGGPGPTSHGTDSEPELSFCDLKLELDTA
jgi:glyoxylase-like metal-dependent hydrolase (beta-lactamase superfamily II)